MPEEDDNASEVDEGTEVLSMIFVTNDESSEVVEPCKEPFDVPPMSVLSQGSTDLDHPDSVGAVRRDEFEATLLFDALVERVTVACSITDKAIGCVLEHALANGGLDEGYFVGRSTCDINGDRKTMSVCDCWKRRWHAWCGGYRSDKSFRGAPVRSTHKMPVSTSRGSRHGRPRPSGRR